MADAEKRSPLKSLRMHTNHAMLAGALTLSGCNAPHTTPAQQNETEEALPEMQKLPPLPPVYSELGEDRLSVELVLGEKYLPLDVSPGQDPKELSDNLNREIRAALRHPERYDHIALRVRDIAGELPPCRRPLAIPADQRTRAGLSRALDYVLRDETTVNAVLGCDAVLRASHWLPGEAPTPTPRETIDPQSIVLNDDSRRRVQSTRLQDNPLHRA